MIVHGRTRSEAIARMKRALDEVVLEGVDTNLNFLYGILEQEAFENGTVDTDFLEEHMELCQY